MRSSAGLEPLRASLAVCAQFWLCVRDCLLCARLYVRLPEPRLVSNAAANFRRLQVAD